ncbi:MAG: PEP/pyruvate-binding domain-containing protein [Pseudonocardiaceae bacterium]
MLLIDDDLVVPLCDVVAADAARVGCKAATLGELLRVGFPVPDGVVLTTAALARALAAAGLDATASPEQVQTCPVPDVSAEALPHGPLAVRSSGVEEDLPDASYAGQYETVLGVAVDDLPSAVRRCWASAFRPQVAAYRAARDEGSAPAMAVLIQPMVPADAAGVAFSADPVTGDREAMVVSAVRGLGDRLVGGTVSPDDWVVRDGAVTCRAAPEGALDAGTVNEVAQLARRVAAHLGAPQDIEWALTGGALVLLQARPITALPDPAPAPVPVPVEVPPGFWRRLSVIAPKPWTPMQRSVMHEPAARATRRLYAEFGFLLEASEITEIGGWTYVRRVPLGGRDRSAPPAWLMPLLIRAVPRLRRRVRDCVAAARSDKAGDFVRRWYEEWQPDLAARIPPLRDVDLAALDDRELDDHAGAVLALYERGLEINILLHAPLGLMLAELAFACRDLLGWTDTEAFELLTGLSTASTEPARQVVELAGMAAHRPAVRDLLGQVDAGTADRITAADPAFAVVLDAYRRESCYRVLSYEIADPTIAEIPELSLRLVADQLARDHDPAAEVAALSRRRAEAVAAARSALAARPATERDRFERALARAERVYPVREGNGFFTVSVPVALLRYAVLEIGARLAARGLVSRRDDVFFLELGDARAALAGAGDRRALVTRRRGERAWIEQHPGPASYGIEPDPPVLDGLPPEARSAAEAMLWDFERLYESGASGRRQAAGARALTGVAASAGRYTGTVRVIMDESGFGKLRPGDVLVCPITSPVWSVLFASVGALVTDTGGHLAHAAIIAREYGIPGVLATGNATELLRDGQLVTVDGSAGIVALHP